MKRILSVLLALGILMGLWVPTASAADAYTTQQLQDVIVETALAYYYKGNAVQYDSFYLAGGDRHTSGLLRQTNNRQPEDSSMQDIHYTVCSGFPHDVYFSVFGEHAAKDYENVIELMYHDKLPYLNGGEGLTEAEMDEYIGLDSISRNYNFMGIFNQYATDAEKASTDADDMVVYHTGIAHDSTYKNHLPLRVDDDGYAINIIPDASKPGCGKYESVSAALPYYLGTDGKKIPQYTKYSLADNAYSGVSGYASTGYLGGPLGIALANTTLSTGTANFTLYKNEQGQYVWSSCTSQTGLPTEARVLQELDEYCDCGKCTRSSDILKNHVLQPGDILGVMIPAKTTYKNPNGVTKTRVSMGGGHCMLYLGDVFKNDPEKYIIHSWGGKYNNDTNSTGDDDLEADPDAYLDAAGNVIVGYDKLEAASSWISASNNGQQMYSHNGSIAIQPFFQRFDPARIYCADTSYWFTVIRPTEVMNEITPQAKFRMQYPALSVTKTVQGTGKSNRGLLAGQVYGTNTWNDNDLLVTITLKNNSQDDLYTNIIGDGTHGAVRDGVEGNVLSGLHVTEQVPVNGTLIEETDPAYTVNGKQLTWNIGSLAAGETKELSFRVKINSGCGGQTMYFPEGKVYGTDMANVYVNTSDASFRILAARFPYAYFNKNGNAKVSHLSDPAAGDVTTDASAPRENIDIANDVYASMGYKLDLPEIDELVRELTEIVNLSLDSSANQKDYMLRTPDQHLTAEGKRLASMLVDGFVGGNRLHTTTENLYPTNLNRLRTLQEGDFVLGDILVFANRKSGLTELDESKCKVYVCVGKNGTTNLFATYDKTANTYTVIEDTITTYTSTKDSNGKYVGQVLSTGAPGSIGSNQPAEQGSRLYAHSPVLYQSFLQDLFFVLRPAQAVENGSTIDETFAAVDPASTSFAVEVKKSGDTTSYGFATLKDAYNYAGNQILAAAEANVAAEKAYETDLPEFTLTLHEDIELSQGLQMQKGGVTLDLNGHTIKGADTFSGTFEYMLYPDGLKLQSGEKNANWTIKNGTILGSTYVGYGGATVHFENMKLTGKNWGTEAKHKRALDVAGNATLENVQIATESRTCHPITRKLAGTTILNDVTIVTAAPLKNTQSVTAADTETAWIPGEAPASKLATGVAMYETLNSVHFDISAVHADDATESDGCIAYVYATEPTVYNETTKVGYASLADALNNVAKDNVLKLNRDIDTSDIREGNAHSYNGASNKPGVNYFYNINKVCTLDMQGHLISDSVSEGFLLRTVGSGSCVLMNGTLRSVNASCLYTIGGDNVLSNMELHAEMDSGILQSGNGKSLTLDNSQVYGNTGIICRDGTILLKNGSVVGGLRGTALYFQASGSNVAEGVTMERAKLLSWVYDYNLAGKGHVTYAANAGTAGITVAAGYKPESVEDYAEVDGVMRRLSSLSYTTDPVCQQGDTKYYSMEEALTAAKSGELTMLVDAILNESAVIPAGVTLNTGRFTLTVPEGKTLTVAGTIPVGANIAADASQLILSDAGNYCGITIPEGMTGTVHPAADMNSGASYNLELDSEIIINCYLDSSVTSKYDEYFLWDTAASEALNLGGATALADGVVRIPARRSAAKKMADEVEIVLTGKTGSAYYVGAPVTLSIQSYANEILNNTDWNDSSGQELGRLMVAMLNYGAQAQLKFNYNASALANAAVTQTQQGYLDAHFTNDILAKERIPVTKAEGIDSGIFYGSSCVLDSSINLKLYFYVDKNKYPDGLTFDISYQNYLRDTKPQTVQLSDMKLAAANVYSYTITNLAAADINAPVYFTAKNGDHVVMTGVDSIGSYLARLYGQESTYRNLCDSMLIYGLAAKEYFVSTIIGGNPDELPIA